MNIKKFYGGYGIKIKRAKINKKLEFYDCPNGCVTKQIYQWFCQTCGARYVTVDYDKSYYPSFDKFIPDDIYDEFDVIYSEGNVYGLDECECYVVNCSNYLDPEEGYAVVKQINKFDSVLFNKWKKYLPDDWVYSEPELISVYYGEF